LSETENPIPEHGIGRYRWAFGPATHLEYLSGKSGPHTMFLKYRNPHPRQTVRVCCNRRPCHEETLSICSYDTPGLLIAGMELDSGPNEIRLEFSRWAQDARDPRPLALIVEELRFVSAG